MSDLSESIVRKDIKLEERYEHCDKGCELYFVLRVEPSSILPTTFTKRKFVWTFALFLQCPFT